MRRGCAGVPRRAGRRPLWRRRRGAAAALMLARLQGARQRPQARPGSSRSHRRGNGLWGAAVGATPWGDRARLQRRGAPALHWHAGPRTNVEHRHPAGFSASAAVGAEFLVLYDSCGCVGALLACTLARPGCGGNRGCLLWVLEAAPKCGVAGQASGQQGGRGGGGEGGSELSRAARRQEGAAGAAARHARRARPRLPEVRWKLSATGLPCPW